MVAYDIRIFVILTVMKVVKQSGGNMYLHYIFMTFLKVRMSKW